MAPIADSSNVSTSVANHTSYKRTYRAAAASCLGMTVVIVLIATLVLTLLPSTSSLARLQQWLGCIFYCVLPADPCALQALGLPRTRVEVLVCVSAKQQIMQSQLCFSSCQCLHLLQPVSVASWPGVCCGNQNASDSMYRFGNTMPAGQSRDSDRCLGCRTAGGAGSNKQARQAFSDKQLLTDLAEVLHEAKGHLSMTPSDVVASLRLAGTWQQIRRLEAVEVPQPDLFVLHLFHCIKPSTRDGHLLVDLSALVESCTCTLRTCDVVAEVWC